MDNSDANEPILRPDPGVEDERKQFEDNIRYCVLKPLNTFKDISMGVHLSFQFLALLISSTIEDIPAICISSVFILITQGGLVKFMNPSSIKIVRRLTLFAVIFGATLVSSYSWRIYHFKNVYDYCTTYHTCPETLDILTFASCQCLIHRVVIAYRMVFCGVMMVVSKGFFLLFCFVHSTKTQSF